LFANLKRTYDEFQQESLQAIRDARGLGNQLMQNAIETANMVAKKAVQNMDAIDKQHLAHRDVATDNLWNPVQIGAGDAVTMRSITLDDASLKAIGAVVAASIAEALSRKDGGA
jgi:hypothetical protein